MQLHLIINVNERPLELPIAHHHILASVFYGLMGTEESVLHDTGKKYGKREYRLFTFGPIRGQYRIDRSRRKICFIGRMEIEFRALNPRVVLAVASNALQNGVTFGNYVYTDVQCNMTDRRIEEDSIDIVMASPICVHKTIRVCERRTLHKKRKTVYLRPESEHFSDAVRDNFIRKYAASEGELPSKSICLEMLEACDKDKYVTRYKENTLEGYKGTYRLTGPPEYLTFLYNVGIGGKNSQGFGMFCVKGKNSER